MAQQIVPSSGQLSHATNISASSPLEFKRQLLAALDDEGEMMYLLSIRKWDEIVIFRFQGIEYVLACDVEAIPWSVDLGILLIIHVSDWTLAFDFKSSMMTPSIVIVSLNTPETNNART